MGAPSPWGSRSLGDPVFRQGRTHQHVLGIPLILCVDSRSISRTGKFQARDGDCTFNKPTLLIRIIVIILKELRKTFLLGRDQKENITTGMLTFLFTDLEDSTRLWEQFPEVMRPALERHDLLLKQTVETHGGRIVKTTGDGLHAVFESPADGVARSVGGSAGDQQ